MITEKKKLFRLFW